MREVDGEIIERVSKFILRDRARGRPGITGEKWEAEEVKDVARGDANATVDFGHRAAAKKTSKGAGVQDILEKEGKGAHWDEPGERAGVGARGASRIFRGEALNILDAMRLRGLGLVASSGNCVNAGVGDRWLGVGKSRGWATKDLELSHAKAEQVKEVLDKGEAVTLFHLCT